MEYLTRKPASAHRPGRPWGLRRKGFCSCAAKVGQTRPHQAGRLTAPGLSSAGAGGSERGRARTRRERIWGGGGGAGPEPGGGGAAAGLLWRPTRGGGGDPPPSTWTVAEAWADVLTPGRGGRAAAATAEAARGRGRLTVAEPSLGSALRPFYGPGRRRRVSVPFVLRPLGPAAGRSGASRRPARAVDGESCAERSRAREAPPLTVSAGRRLRRSSPGRGPHRLPSARDRPAFVWGPGRRGEPLADGRARGPPPCGCYLPAARPSFPASTAAVPAME